MKILTGAFFEAAAAASRRRISRAQWRVSPAKSQMAETMGEESATSSGWRSSRLFLGAVDELEEKDEKDEDESVGLRLGSGRSVEDGSVEEEVRGAAVDGKEEGERAERDQQRKPTPIDGEEIDKGEEARACPAIWISDERAEGGWEAVCERRRVGT
jgi:hypothetical protein